MTNFTVTLAALRKEGACINGYNKVVRAVQDREFSNYDRMRATYIRFAYKDPIPLALIVESNGLEDALWALRCVKGCDRDTRLFAVWCARQVQHLMTDARSTAALDVAENFANDRASNDELDAAWAAARDAAWAAALDAARDAAWATWDAALDAARDAAWAAARDAAWAAWAAARDAARDAARAAQKRMFIDMCNGFAPWQAQPK
jgi:hypothetical protein